MREQAEVLEDHGHVVPPELPQLGLAGGADVVPRDLDRPRGRLDEPDQRSHERRLPGAREPHHDEHLARPDLDRDVADGDDAPRLLAQLAAGQVGVLGADEALPARPEDLPHAVRADDGRLRAIDPALRRNRRDRGRARFGHTAASRFTRAADISLGLPLVHSPRQSCAVTPGAYSATGSTSVSAHSGSPHSHRSSRTNVDSSPVDHGRAR